MKVRVESLEQWKPVYMKLRNGISFKFICDKGNMFVKQIDVDRKCPLVDAMLVIGKKKML